MSDYTKIDERKYWLKCLVNDILGNDDLCGGCKYVDHGICHQCRRIGANEIIKIIDDDAEPVRHGRWVDVDRMQMHDLHGVLTWGNSFMCTECNFKTFAVEGHMSQYHYCPNCGARMDGDSDETD